MANSSAGQIASVERVESEGSSVCSACELASPITYRIVGLTIWELMMMVAPAQGSFKARLNVNESLEENVEPVISKVTV